MTTDMLAPLLRPRSVAVIGASKGRTATGGPKLGTATLDYLVDHGFPGAIHPVNPKETELRGRRCYPNVRDIPGDVDLALFVIPAESCVAAMADCAAKGVRAALVFASGFAEAGHAERQAQLVAAARQGGVRFVGPNTNGLVSLGEKLVASTSMVCGMNPFLAGDIAFIAQSGGVGGSMFGGAMEDLVGFSHWVSTGNEADLDAAEIMDALVEDDRVRVFALFLEGVRDAPKFLAACRKAARARKPVVVYKIGLSEVAAQASASHTGALAGSDRIFDAVCRQFGLIRVDDAAELLPTAAGFSWLGDKLPKGDRVGIIAPSGGIVGVAADECARWGLDVPELDAATQAHIRDLIPPFAATRNPVDVTQQITAYPTGYQDTIRAVLAADYIDGLLLLVTMVGEPRASFYGREFSAIAQETDKPVIVAWTGAVSLAPEGFPMLKRNRVPTFRSARGAVKAMRALADYRAFLDRFEAEDAA